MSNTLISFLEFFEPTNEVQTLLHTIITIQAKFEKDDAEDLRFQTTKDMHLNQLETAKERYTMLLGLVNEGSLADCNADIQRIKDEIKNFKSKYEMNSITGMWVNKLNTQLERACTFKEIKEKYNTLKPLDELLKDEKALMEMFH